MSPEDYKRERTLRGTQESVAAQLGVDRVTIARRETGALPITREAELALLSLPAARPISRTPSVTLLDSRPTPA